MMPSSPCSVIEKGVIFTPSQASLRRKCIRKTPIKHQDLLKPHNQLFGERKVKFWITKTSLCEASRAPKAIDWNSSAYKYKEKWCNQHLQSHLQQESSTTTSKLTYEKERSRKMRFVHKNSQHKQSLRNCH